LSLSISQLYHTLRWLRPRQIVGQLHYHMPRPLERPQSWARRPVAPDPGRRWAPHAEFLPPGLQHNGAEALRAGEFSFLNRSERLGWPPRWEIPELPPLWQYNLHYFEYLWALPYEDGCALVRDWFARYELARGRPGWDPYPVSLRIENWCAYFFGRHRARAEGDAELAAQLWGSLQLQAEWLAAHLEYRLLGNHLLENAAALAFCGACFEGSQAEAWLRTGLELLARELPEQVLPDGGHFERSPMYHARVAYLLGMLLNTGNQALERCVREPLERMLGALDKLRHPDGEIALLNDSAFGIANHPSQLAEPASSTGCFALPDTGYYGARSAAGHYVVCDAAPIGPDYIPGHAHGDIFSFELSLGGQRVIVDAGVYGYDADAMRGYCRSTRAHNTVEVEGEDQCEFWAAFRVARRGRPRDVAWSEIEAGFRLEGWHDGYERLAGRARHRRSFRWHPEGVLLVRDLVTAKREVSVRSRLHLHPSCELEEVEATRARLRYPGGEFTLAVAGAGELSAEPSAYCPEFGRKLENRALAVSARGARVETGFCVANGSGAVGYDLAAGAEVGGARYSW